MLTDIAAITPFVGLLLIITAWLDSLVHHQVTNIHELNANVLSESKGKARVGESIITYVFAALYLQAFRRRLSYICHAVTGLIVS